MARRTSAAEQTVGQYELRGLLGEGGIGQVYVARDTVLGRQVAIKTLRPEFARDRNFLDRFFAEAQSLANLSHPNITTLYGFEAKGPRPFMAMELVRGHTLAALLARLQRLPQRETLAVLSQAAAGLAYAHGEGVVHRDIKPENLMVTDRGLLKIMDFGIARVQGAKRLTRAGQIFGTLFYASPEQIRGGEIDQRSDLYSLAVVLYEMLAGAPPFSSDNEHALMTAHLEAPPPPLAGRVPGLSGGLEAAIMRALAKRPEDRFASVEAFARAAGSAAVRGEENEILQPLIGAAFRNTPPPATRFLTGAATDHRAPAAKHVAGAASLWKPASLVITLALGLGAGAAYLLLSSPPTPPPPPRFSVSEPASAPAQPVGVSPPGAGVAPTEPPGRPAALAPTAMQPPAPPAETTPPPAAAPRAARQQPPSTTLIPTNPGHDEAGLPPNEAVPGPVAALPVPRPITPPSPPSPPPETTPPTPQPATSEMPPADLTGVVTSIGSASLLSVAKKPIELWGIEDPTRHLEHKQIVYGYLKDLSNGRVSCFHRKGDRYQCFAGGQDLALVALHYGLARLTADAPPEYREAAR